MSKRARRTFSKEFKEQMVKLHASGKPCSEIIREYELTPSSCYKLVCQYYDNGSFQERQSYTKTGRVNQAS